MRGLEEGEVGSNSGCQKSEQWLESQYLLQQLWQQLLSQPLQSNHSAIIVTILSMNPRLKIVYFWNVRRTTYPKIIPETCMLLDYAKITTCCHITGGWSCCVSCCSSYSRCCLCNVTVQQILRLFHETTNSKNIQIFAQIVPPHMLVIAVFLLIVVTECLVPLTIIEQLQSIHGSKQYYTCCQCNSGLRHSICCSSCCSGCCLSLYKVTIVQQFGATVLSTNPRLKILHNFVLQISTQCTSKIIHTRYWTKWIWCCLLLYYLLQQLQQA